MIEIHSDKIDKDLLKKKIEENISQYTPKLKLHKKKYINAINFKQLDVYLVSDFTKYHDEEFIKNVYLGVLKREVDKFSLEHYLNEIRTGNKSKSEILAIIRYSKEGRTCKTNILGIKKRYFLAVMYKLPYIGYLFKSIVALLTLPKMLKRYNSLEANYLMNSKNVNEEISKKVDINDVLYDLEIIKNNISQEHENLKNIFEDKSKETKNKFKETENKFIDVTNQIQAYINDVNNAKSYLRDVESNLKVLMENIDKTITNKELVKADIFKNVIEEKEHLLDDLYIAFEDKFRGLREDIKSRQKYYLPILQKVIKEKSEVVIDVGCGRGEWIELLTENNIKAKGIDLNRSMVNKSKEYGLDAINIDAITYLKSLEKESISVVTGFHIVEHLPFEVLISLFDESLRVLKKGGMIIFETPNPENLLVGSCTFYTDPTHINPIPPVTLEFLALNRGFSKIDIHRLHPIKEPQYLEGENRDDINALIFASTKEQDYAIVGFKS